MKHGYTCKCGWRLLRGVGRNRLTRKQYANAKTWHATGNFVPPMDSKVAAAVKEPPKGGCEFLRSELTRSRTAVKR